MCRRNILNGFVLISFGTGILIGRWMNSWFWCTVCGIGMITVGVTLLRRR